MTHASAARSRRRETRSHALQGQRVLIDWERDGPFVPTGGAVIVDHSRHGFGAIAVVDDRLAKGSVIRARIGANEVGRFQIRWCANLDETESHFGCVRVD